MERQLITLHDIFELYYENNKQYGTIITKMIVDYDMHTTNTNDLPNGLDHSNSLILSNQLMTQ